MGIIRTKLAVLGAGAMALSSLAGISLTASPATAAGASTCNVTLPKTGTTTIDYWESASGSSADKTTPEGVMTTIVNKFNASQNKVHVNRVSQQSYQDGTWTPYVQSLSNHTQPDILYFDNFQNQQAYDSGTFIPVADCVAAAKFSTKDYLPKAIAQQTINGKLMGMPFAMSAPVMYYNKQAFANAHITKPPTTFAELAIDAQKLTNASWTYSGKSGTYTDGISVKNDPWWLQIWNGMSNQYYVNNQNGRKSRATSSSFNNADSLQLVTAIHNMVKAGTAKSYSGQGTGLAAFNNLFAISSNKSGITFDTSSALGTIGGYLPLFKNVTLGVAPLPTLNGGKQGVQPGGQTLYLPKNTNPDKVAAAWTFMQYLESPAIMAQWDAGTGYNPVRSSTAAMSTMKTLWAKHPEYKVAYTEILAGTTNNATVGPLVGPYSQVNDAVANALAAAFTEPNADPKTLLNQAQAAANAAIASYNSSL